MNWQSLIPEAPFDWALIPLNGDKKPLDDAWTSFDGYDLDGISEHNGSVKAVGLMLGPKSGGVLQVDFDGPDSTSKFQAVFGRSPKELPPTIGVTSGKESRGSRFFLVDQDWWDSLRGRKTWKDNDGNICLELRWAGHQAAIAGAHPETDGYRWLPDSSPAAREMATAPDWLLDPLIRSESNYEPVEPTAADAERAINMLRHIDASTRTDYDGWLEVGMALHHTDSGLLSSWVQWSKQMVNFDEEECLAKWQGFADYKGTPLTIGTLHHFAKQGGYKEPKAPKTQPQDLTTSPDFISGVISDAEGLKHTLDEGLKAIDGLSDVAMRSVALVQLQRSIGLTEKQFLALIHQLAEHKEEAPPEDFESLLAYADGIATDPIVEDLLGVGLSLFAADGGTGKSCFAYELIEAVTTGGKFAGQFQAKQNPCLVVQLDESPKDALVKWRRMDFQPLKSEIHFLWKFNPMMFPELRAKVEATRAKVIVLDSLVSIAGGQINAKDAEFGLLIYRLNKLASELGVAIICIHHLSKNEKGKERSTVAKEDIYGSAYVFNGTADAWGYWGFREDGNPEPLFALKILKNRSNLAELHTVYEFEGSHEDHRLRFRGIRDRVISLNQIKNHRERVRQFLCSRPGTIFTVKEVNEGASIGSDAYCKRILAELYQARVGVDRKRLPSTGGRPPYGYFGKPLVPIGEKSLARVSPHLVKEVSLSSLSLDSLSSEGGSKGVPKAPKEGGLLSLEPREHTREESQTPVSWGHTLDHDDLPF